jgi:acyl-CoA reductase-like NAD-dependent aldehyde dehydrogenase
MRNLISRNPYSGEIKEQLSYFTEEMLEKCIERSSLAFAIQAKRTSKDKMNMIKELLPQIERQKTEISKLITFETGKPII